MFKAHVPLIKDLCLRIFVVVCDFIDFLSTIYENNVKPFNVNIYNIKIGIYQIYHWLIIEMIKCTFWIFNRKQLFQHSHV